VDSGYIDLGAPPVRNDICCSTEHLGSLGKTMTFEDGPNTDGLWWLGLVRWANGLISACGYSFFSVFFFLILFLFVLFSTLLLNSDLFSIIFS
jgi:cellulose synthase/poly-beta-1,6-N-acetylglucosamine synthase-like glycosyltransferase